MTKRGKHHESKRRRVKRLLAVIVYIVCAIMVPFPLDPIIKESPHDHDDGGFLYPKKIPDFLTRLK